MPLTERNRYYESRALNNARKRNGKNTTRKGNGENNNKILILRHQHLHTILHNLEFLNSFVFECNLFI